MEPIVKRKNRLDAMCSTTATGKPQTPVFVLCPKADNIVIADSSSISLIFVTAKSFLITLFITRFADCFFNPAEGGFACVCDSTR